MAEDIPQISQPKSIRLTQDEIRFLDEHNIKLSELARNSIEFEMEKKEKEQKMKTKKQKINNMVINGLFLIIGIMFLWTLNYTANIISIVIVAGIGFGFSVIGGLNMYKAMKAEGMLNVGKHK